jgi:hypothetical protein
VFIPGSIQDVKNLRKALTVVALAPTNWSATSPLNSFNAIHRPCTKCVNDLASRCISQWCQFHLEIGSLGWIPMRVPCERRITRWFSSMVIYSRILFAMVTLLPRVGRSRAPAMDLSSLTVRSALIGPWKHSGTVVVGGALAADMGCNVGGRNQGW